VFVAQPEDVEWVLARLGQAKTAQAGLRRQVRKLPPISRMPPPPPPVDQRMGSDPKTFPANPPPFPADAPKVEPLPGLPSDPPKIPELIPPDISGLDTTIVGGTYPLPKDWALPLPGFPIPDDRHPARTPLLVMQSWHQAEFGPNGEFRLAWAEHKKLKARDPRFGLADEIYKEAGRRTTESGGSALGIEWHHIAKNVVRDCGDEGKAQGVRAEVTYDENGELGRYGQKDAIRVDLVWRRHDGVYVVVDLKTGGAQLSAKQVRQIVKNVGGGDSEKVLVYQYKP
jgi:hypothetical protein